ncbi:hypothetical protein [Levilactobacillus acidifarinae]|nr:hypothetical protein [Levilactobacillus acidifarinae]GEO68169.1 hypothetical protein LAC03_00790 [Levilactobacillus acidifarinae]
MSLDHQKLVYFKVTSGNGHESGYVWHGYLTKGKYSSPIQSSQETAPNKPATIVATDYLGHTMTTADIDNSLDRQLLSLFPGTINDPKTQLLAENYYLALKFEPTDAFNDDVSSAYPKDVWTERQVVSIKRLTNPKTSFLKFEKHQLSVALTGRPKFNDYVGYHIGAYAFPKGSGRYGEAMVLLIPPFK